MKWIGTCVTAVTLRYALGQLRLNIFNEVTVSNLIKNILSVIYLLLNFFYALPRQKEGKSFGESYYIKE